MKDLHIYNNYTISAVIVLLRKVDKESKLKIYLKQHYLYTYLT